MEDQPLVYERTKGSSASCQGGNANAEDGSAGESVQTGLEKGRLEVILAGLLTTAGLQSVQMTEQAQGHQSSASVCILPSWPKKEVKIKESVP